MRYLTPDTLASLPATIRRPDYPRAKLELGMVHIGVGAFHRCHQADYTDDALEAQFGPWGVTGVNLRPPRLTETLVRQDGLYSRTLREGTASQTRIIGCLRRSIDVETAGSAEAAIAAIAAPSTKLVTMTLTEKGYCHVPATGKPDRSNADWKHDLQGAEIPRTAFGLLAAALERRQIAGLPGITLISCDNIPANGAILRSSLIAFAATRPGPLLRWIETNIAFPSTMVDRIVPASTEADGETIAASLGLVDRAPVVGEPFRQWVIEDRFAAARPPWELAGVQFVADVRPYEYVKMRVLNAAQSTLSHLGAILGHRYSFEAAADPVLAQLVRRMIEEETAATLPAASGMELPAYLDTSFTRIRNPAIRHFCHQIGTDGSQKIVQRILNPLCEQRAAGRPAERLILATAGWIAYGLCGCERFGARWTPVDPWAARIQMLGEQLGGDLEMTARAILSIEAIFGTDLADETMVRAIAHHLAGLLSDDPRGYLAAEASR